MILKKVFYQLGSKGSSNKSKAIKIFNSHNSQPFPNFAPKYLFSHQKHVFLFGGQGNQQKGMFQKLLTIPQAKQIIQQQTKNVGIDFLQITSTDFNNVINLTKYTQPILLLSHYLEFYYGENKISDGHKMGGYNIYDTYCIGHSLGEYSALVVSESISLTECLKLVIKRGQLMMKASEGEKYGTLLIKYHPSKQQALFKIVQKMNLEIACYNTKSIVLISGTFSQLTQLKDVIKHQLRIASRVLPVSTAFHSKALQSMSKQYEQILNQIDFKQPKYKIVRNIDGQIYKTKKDIIQGLQKQNTRPVLFSQSIQKIIKKQGKENIRFVEFGHKQYLKRWAEEVVKQL